VSLQFDGIHKSFGAINALTGVSFDVAAGSAHALVGENGAGKSTLLKILAGLIAPGAGEIRWHGRVLKPSGPRQAIEHGIGMVYQEMLCFPNLTVTGNIFAGRELTRRGMLDNHAMRTRTSAILQRLSLPIDPDTPAEQLSAAHRQLLQVARALAFDCEILVLDEPTTALTDNEADHLFDVLRELKRGGTTLLYVSHRLPEVFRLCDRITVLRDGALVGTYDRDAMTPNDIVKAMVGRDLPARSAVARRDDETARRAEADRRAKADGAEADRAAGLALTGLTRRPHFRDVTIRVERGEIVAIFGLVGSGRSELLETIFGLHRPDSGTIAIDGEAAHFASASEAVMAGVALVPEERQRQGLFFNLALRPNLVLARSGLTREWLVRESAEHVETTRMLADWRIKAPDVECLPDSLSGGNQQKVVLAKWLAVNPRVLLLDEPTKGVDVGAKFEIHEMIRRQAAGGLAVLVVSSDLPEVLAIADRIVVMKEGEIQGELAGAAATEQTVMHLATHDPFDSPGGASAAGFAQGRPA
jgi:rhamnose transport system ATP-binding protein